MYLHNRAFNAMRAGRQSTANGSIDFNNAFTQVASKRNPTTRMSFSDESDVGSVMMGSIDLSAHHIDFFGASSSSDESIPQSTVCLD